MLTQNWNRRWALLYFTGIFPGYISYIYSVLIHDQVLEGISGFKRKPSWSICEQLSNGLHYFTYLYGAWEGGVRGTGLLYIPGTIILCQQTVLWDFTGIKCVRVCCVVWESVWVFFRILVYFRFGSRTPCVIVESSFENMDISLY